ncbi:MAG: DUF4446 family protein [Nocardioidaceae bacterium]|nr:DUF4446 family protein [Nocardioidaceae bacterium]
MPWDKETLSRLVLLALVLALVALVLALAAFLRAGRSRRRTTARKLSPPRPRKTAPLSTDEVTAALQGLQADVASSLRHLAVVRYDAFGDMGGHLSWSMALLDDSGDGVVLTSIHGRSDSRTYAKNIAGWSANQQLSPEEDEAIGFARSNQ